MIRIETFRVGMRELSGNKLRTMLTTLGIVFGVAAVIAMVSIAEGARLEAVQQIESMGTSTVRVRSLKLEGHDLSRARQMGITGLDLQDLDALAMLATIERAAPVREIEDAVVKRGERTADARVVGTTATHAEVTPLPLAQGRFLVDEDVRAGATVAVLGAKVAQDVLPFRPPIGEEVVIGTSSFRVIGVLEDKRQSAARATGLAQGDVGRDVYIPVTTARLRFPVDPLAPPLSEIALRVEEGSSVRSAAELVRDALSRRHAGLEDFEVIVPEELLRQSQRSQRIFNVVMGAIASISLLVGGIGIMNVMLVTVIQRTREIGIRRAVGATRKDVRDQFLVEALIIAVLGGLVGALIGSGLAAAIALYAGWTTVVSPFAVTVAFFVAGATGVAFGLFPAVKASRMDPIDCLRHE